MSVEQFDTHALYPKQKHCHGNWGQSDREEQGKLKEDAKCSSSLSVSKRERVPQMEIEDTVWMQRPGTV